MNDQINTTEETTIDATMETTMNDTIETTNETTMEETIEPTVNESAETTAETTVEAKVDRRKENPGRKPKYSDKWGIIDSITAIGATDGRYHYNMDDAKVSRVLTLQLVELGFVEAYKDKVTEGRGRAKMFYRLTGKGKSYLALSSRWKKPEEATVKTTEPTVTESPEPEITTTPELVPAE